MIIDIDRARKDIRSRIYFLGLNTDEYFLGGSAIMQYLGIRWARDLDVFVRPSTFFELWDRNSFDLKWPENDYLHKYDPPFLRALWFETEPICYIDIFYEWRKRPNGFGNIDVRRGILQAEIIDGISFMSLKEIYRWKSEVRREKDLPDLKLIEEYWEKDRHE